jgi:glutathione peroxidase
MISSSLSAASFYDIVEKDSSGNDVPFSKFKGKVVYGVNVASKCGYTASGYSLLSRIAALKDKGVEVAIFPCNQVLMLSNHTKLRILIILITFI